MISTAIYSYTEIPGGEEKALRLAIVSIVIATLALVASEILNRRIQRRIATFE
jgi:molybdate transport system permease protein